MQRIDISEPIDAHARCNSTQIVANEIYNGVVLGGFLVIVQDDLVGVRQMGIDGSFHRVRKNFPVYNLHKPFGRETDKFIGDAYPIHCPAVSKNLLERERRKNRRFQGEVGQKRVAVTQPRHHLIKPFLIGDKLFGRAVEPEVGNVRRIIWRVGEAVYVKQNVGLPFGIRHKKTFPHFEIHAKQKRGLGSSRFVHFQFYIVGRGKHAAKLVQSKGFSAIFAQKEKMNKEDLRIVFMGTPHFAVESLKALVENNYNIVGVITAPDKPAGRGHKFQPSAVKEYALKKGLHILQPENLKNEVFLNELRRLEADIQVVVAFRMLPEAVWNMPARGTFNLHASLLPQYRGAAPINWAIINGESETGVTTFFLKHEIDTGEVIFQEKTPIGEDDNAETVHDKLMMLGSQLVLKTIDAVIDGTVRSQPQSAFFDNEKELKPAPKIFKETGKIDWNKPAQDIHNLVRGLSPYPAAWTEFEVNGEKQNFKIFDTKIIGEPHSFPSGQLITDNKTTLRVTVPDGFIEILDIQLSGKKRMKVNDFLNGFSF